MSERIQRIDSDGVCTLIFNRPDKLNALDTPFFEEMDAHLARLENETDTIGCVVLRGAGRGFCAGADINGIGKSSVAPTFKPGVIERLERLPQPVIAAVHGVCYTGGLELALACDFIVADASARFADTHGKWGLVAAWGMIQRLPRRVGSQVAKRLMGETGGTRAWLMSIAIIPDMPLITRRAWSASVKNNQHRWSCVCSLRARASDPYRPCPCAASTSTAARGRLPSMTTCDPTANVCCGERKVRVSPSAVWI